MLDLPLPLYKKTKTGTFGSKRGFVGNLMESKHIEKFCNVCKHEVANLEL